MKHVKKVSVRKAVLKEESTGLFGSFLDPVADFFKKGNGDENGEEE